MTITFLRLRPAELLAEPTRPRADAREGTTTVEMS